jgi:hypothetical protein
MTLGVILVEVAEVMVMDGFVFSSNGIISFGLG